MIGTYDPVPTSSLCLVEVSIRFLYELIHMESSGYREASADGEIEVSDEPMLSDVLSNPFGDLHRLIQRDVLENDEKFLSSISTETVVSSDRPLDLTSDLNQHLITDKVSVSVVHLLEVVDIEHERHDVIPSHDRLLKAQKDGSSTEDTGEHIMIHHLLQELVLLFQLVFHILLPGDVEYDSHQLKWTTFAIPLGDFSAIVVPPPGTILVLDSVLGFVDGVDSLQVSTHLVHHRIIILRVQKIGEELVAYSLRNLL